MRTPLGPSRLAHCRVHAFTARTLCQSRVCVVWYRTAERGARSAPVRYAYSTRVESRLSSTVVDCRESCHNRIE